MRWQVVQLLTIITIYTGLLEKTKQCVELSSMAQNNLQLCQFMGKMLRSW